jgi:hypothetical protein
MMRRSFLRAVIIATIVIQLGTTVASAAGDPHGWREARWGMSGEDLAQTFKGTLEPVGGALEFNNYVVRQRIIRTEIGGRPFVVLFQLDKDSEKLKQVLLQYRGSRPMHTDYVEVGKALAAELGAPSRARGQGDYSGSFPSSTSEMRWCFPSTEIVLRYVDPNSEAYSGQRKDLVIRYSERSGKCR